MKSKVLLGALAWVALITVLHLWLNVGWGRLSSEVLRLLGRERRELVVGFLPVT